MRNRLKNLAALGALIVAGLASAATSQNTVPQWEYSETSESQSFTLDTANPTVTFDIVITTNEAMSETSYGDLVVVAYATDAGGPASVLSLLADPQGDQLAVETELTDGQEQGISLTRRWLESCESTCTGSASLTFELSDGPGVTGSFEVTAMASGPYTSEETSEPPAGSDLTIEITQR